MKSYLKFVFERNRAKYVFLDRKDCILEISKDTGIQTPGNLTDSIGCGIDNVRRWEKPV
jgi:hypothetical protein